MANLIDIDDANDYFSLRLHSDPWDEASEQDQTKALTMATKIINKFAYIGDKTSLTQENEFPRDEETEVPTEIKEACCEIALKLLDEVDPDMEIENLNKVQSMFVNVRNNYDKSFIPSHKAVGVPSAQAWQLMLPYLRDSRDVFVIRTQP